jgi:hypothetical protein
MKKTLKTFALMLLTALAFSSCVDVPAPFNLPDKSSNGGGSSEVEGISATCKEALDIINALSNGGATSQTYVVTGYITDVFAISGKPCFWMADTPDGGKVIEAFAASLPEGVAAFEIGMKVKVTGKLKKYVKNDNVTPEVENPTVVVLENGGGSSSGESTLIDFTKGQGSWTIKNVSGLEVWTNSSQYGQVASGFIDNGCKAAEGWLISPEIDLTNSTNTQIVLNEAVNKIATGSSVDSQCQVLACLSGDASGANNWQLLTADKRPAGTSWTFQDDTFNASAFDGKKILIAFKYISTDSSAPSWEIKAVKLKNGNGGGDNGGGSSTSGSSKQNPLSVAQAKNASGNNYVKGYIVGYVDGMTLASGATFAVPSNAETEILLADSPDETNPDNVFPVQLPTGAIRDALELSAHPDYLKQEVLLYGSLEKYFGVQGMKSTSWGQINGQSFGVDPEGGSSSGDNTGESATPQGNGTLDNPYNVAGAINFVIGLGSDVASPQEVYVKGIVKANTTNQSKFEQYGDMTFTMIDKNYENAEFLAYQVLGLENKKFTDINDIKPGDEVVVYGKVVYFKGTTPETSKGTAHVYSINGKTQSDDGQGGNGDDTPPTPGPGGEEVNELVNGNFEEWVSASEPLGWKSASSASSATVEQFQDSHDQGTFSCLIKANPDTNMRLATQEITLAPGTYVFSFYAKAASASSAQTRIGYVPIKADGSVDSYKYNSAFFDINNNEWTYIENEFTLTAETKVCLLVMNPKSNKDKQYEAQDILVDDAALVKK